MPIDFLSIALGFLPGIRTQLEPMGLLFARLKTWLKPRLTALQGLEAATRAFPILHFYNEALTAHVHRSQHDALVPLGPPPALWERAGEHGHKRILAGLGQFVLSVRQEFVLPAIFGAMADLLGQADAAMERYTTIPDDLFDPAKKRPFIALIGQAWLGYRAVATSMPQIKAFVEGGRALSGALTGNKPTQPDEPTQPIGASLLANATMMDGLSRQLVAAILILPTFGQMLDTLIKAGVLAFKMKLLERLQEVEARVMALRISVIGLFTTEMDRFAERQLRFLMAAEYVVLSNLEFFTEFGFVYGSELWKGLSAFLSDLAKWLTDLFDTLLTWLTGIFKALDFDLMPLILKALGIPPALLALLPKPPVLNIKMILSATGTALAAAVFTWSLLLEELVNSPPVQAEEWLRDGTLAKRVEGLKLLSLRLMAGSSKVVPESAFPTSTIDFPDLKEAFLGAGAFPLGAVLEQTRRHVQAETDQLLSFGVSFLQAMGDTFAADAARAGEAGHPALYAAMAGRSDEMVQRLFGREALNARLAAQVGRSPLAEAFDRTIATQGFTVIEKVLPGYIAAMQRYWAERAVQSLQEAPDPDAAPPAGPTETSPHILARRQRLGRVQTPAVTLRVPARALDDSLLDDLARHLQEAVAAAYRMGLVKYGS